MTAMSNRYRSNGMAESKFPVCLISGMSVSLPAESTTGMAPKRPFSITPWLIRTWNAQGKCTFGTQYYYDSIGTWLGSAQFDNGDAPVLGLPIQYEYADCQNHEYPTWKCSSIQLPRDI